MTDEWQPIATAPKDGTDIIAWGHVCGLCLARWTSSAALLSEEEIESSGMSDTEAEECGWFCAGFLSPQSLDGIEPTHWRPRGPLPDGSL